MTSSPLNDINRAESSLSTLYTDLGDIRHDFRNKNLYGLILSLLRGRSLLDIGCGAGHFLFMARHRGFEVSGIEPGGSLIELAEKLYGKTLPIRNLPIESVERIEGTYDNITLIDILEHIKDDAAALAALKRLLTPSGRLIVLVPCHPHLYGQRDRELGHYRRYGKKELEAKLLRAGYQILQSRHWNMLGYLPYLAAEKILKKKLPLGLRRAKEKNFVEKVLCQFLDLWMGKIEKRFDLGFGLSCLCVACLKGPESAGS